MAGKIYGKRWKVHYIKKGGAVSILQDIGLADLRATVGTSRDSGDATPIAGNVKPWLLKHILKDVNSPGPGQASRAEKIIITDTKKADK